jgi:hypothetical protein
MGSSHVNDQDNPLLLFHYNPRAAQVWLPGTGRLAPCVCINDSRQPFSG